jgi:hypothetical protein
MVLTKAFEPPALLVATTTGVITSRDQIEIVGWIREWIRGIGAVRVLLRLEAFAGWRPEAYDDQAGWLRDDEAVVRLAVVGDPAWRRPVLTAMTEPLRRLPIVYFDNESQAREWLAHDVPSTDAIPT